MHKNIPHIPPVEERVERKISAFTSISMCALTVIAQIATSILISFLLAEYSSLVYALLLIAGADKAEIVERAFQGPVTPRVPASVLQLHKDATVILSKA